MSCTATTATTAATAATARLSAWPHLTSQGPRLQLQPRRTFPDHTSAHARRPPPTPRLAFALFPSPVAGRRLAPFFLVRPPSFGEEDGRGRGKRWEVGERARRPSAVVSWLRAAVAASLQLLQQWRRWRKGWSVSGSPRRSCEGSWPPWLRRPGAEVSRTAPLLGRACPPRLPLLLCLLPAWSAALRSPRPFPQQWGRGPEGGPRGRPTNPSVCVGSRSGSSGPFQLSPAPRACLRPLPYREGDCSPIASVFSDLLVDPEPSGDA